MKPAPPESLTREKFSELLRTSFSVQAGPAACVDIELVEVAAAGANSPQYESFSLLFHGPEARPLPQGTYPVEHPGMGMFDLFIVPVAAKSGMRHYQAVFNRLVASA